MLRIPLSKLDPYEEKTRGEFLIEQQGLLECLLAGAERTLRSTGAGYNMVRELRTTLKVTKQLYLTQELTDLDEIEEQIQEGIKDIGNRKTQHQN